MWHLGKCPVAAPPFHRLQYLLCMTRLVLFLSILGCLTPLAAQSRAGAGQYAEVPPPFEVYGLASGLKTVDATPTLVITNPGSNQPLGLRAEWTRIWRKHRLRLALRKYWPDGGSRISQVFRPHWLNLDGAAHARTSPVFERTLPDQLLLRRPRGRVPVEREFWEPTLHRGKGNCNGGRWTGRPPDPPTGLARS